MTNILPTYERRCINITEQIDYLQLRAIERLRVLAYLVNAYPAFEGNPESAATWLDNMETRADGGLNNNASKILDQIWTEALSVQK